MRADPRARGALFALTAAPVPAVTAEDVAELRGLVEEWASAARAEITGTAAWAHCDEMRSFYARLLAALTAVPVPPVTAEDVRKVQFKLDLALSKRGNANLRPDDQRGIEQEIGHYTRILAVLTAVPVPPVTGEDVAWVRGLSIVPDGGLRFNAGSYVTVAEFDRPRSMQYPDLQRKAILAAIGVTREGA